MGVYISSLVGNSNFMSRIYQCIRSKWVLIEHSFIIQIRALHPTSRVTTATNASVNTSCATGCDSVTMEATSRCSAVSCWSPHRSVRPRCSRATTTREATVRSMSVSQRSCYVTGNQTVKMGLTRLFELSTWFSMRDGEGVIGHRSLLILGDLELKKPWRGWIGRDRLFERQRLVRKRFQRDGPTHLLSLILSPEPHFHQWGSKSDFESMCVRFPV